MKKVYVFYSGATDVTGKAITEKLNASGGTEYPKTKPDVLIGWGAKISKDIIIDNQVKVFNHPNNIRMNRNKFESLKKMKVADIPVGAFVLTEEVRAKLKNNQIKFPLIGRTNFHQGGKNFWLCLSKTHVDEAVANGAQYFQEYIPIEKEYRVHVFNNEAFYVAVKTKSKDPKKSYVETHAEKIKNSAEKGGKTIDATAVEFTLSKIAERQQHSNPLLKSHAEGWVFKALNSTDLKTTPIMNLTNTAVKAVKAIGLDFGAVDCGISENNEVFVLEVNTGPSLEGTTFEKWIEKFKKAIDALDKKEEVKKATEDKATTKTAVVGKSFSKKETALQKAALLQELLANAKEEETDSIMSAASRMFNVELKGATKLFNEG